MATYTPLQPGQAPTFGTSGQAVADFQTQLNTQNAGKPGWVPLAVDAKYGPQTQAATQFNPTNTGNTNSGNAIITTGTNPSNQFNQNNQQLNNLLAKVNTTPAPATNPGVQNQQEINNMLTSYSDPYTQMLDKISATSDKATQNLIATIQATKASREQNINVEYDRLKQGLMSLGLSTDKLQYTPDLVYGSITQAENARMGQLQTLDQQESTALLDAQQASDNEDFSLLKDRMDYIKSIQQSRLDVLKNSYDTMSTEENIGKIQAGQVYDELQKLPESQKVPFLQQIATKFDIPLTALTSQVAQITRDRAKKTTTTKSGDTTAAKYTWGNPTSANKTSVEKYLQANSDNFADDLKKAQTDQEFFLYLLNQASAKPGSSGGQTS